MSVSYPLASAVSLTFAILMVQGPRPAEVPGCASLPLDQGLPGDARGDDSCQDQGGVPQLLLPQEQVQGGVVTSRLPT